MHRQHHIGSHLRCRSSDPSWSYDIRLQLRKPYIFYLEEQRLYRHSFRNQQYYGDDPALMEKMALDETTFFDSIAKSVGLFTLVKTIPCIVLTIVFFAIRATFITIEKQDNPFTGKVISRLTTLLVIASVVIGISTGIVYGIMMGFFTYVFYTIMDYGRVLQIQSDETL